MTKEFQPTPVPRAKAAGKPKAGGPPHEDTVRLRGLVPSDLALQEEAERERLGAGYDPYDTYPNVRQPNATQKHADLRKLSEWIRQKRLAERNAPADPASLEDTMPGNKPFWPVRR